MVRFVITGAVTGTIVPVCLFVIREAARWLDIGSGKSAMLLEMTTLGLWPTSILLIGAGSIKETPTMIAVTISIAANAALYGAIAYGLWFGIYKSTIAFLAVAILITLIWLLLSRL